MQRRDRDFSISESTSVPTSFARLVMSTKRSAVLRKAADAILAQTPQLCALLAKELHKSC